MDQKNHSHRDLYLQDFKTIPSLKIETEPNKTGNILLAVFLVAVLGFTASTVYTKSTPSTSGEKSISQQAQPSDSEAIANSEPINAYKLDIVDTAKLVKEPESPLIDMALEPIVQPAWQDPVVADDSLVVMADRIVQQPQYKWITVEIQKGDSLSKIFNRLDLSHKDAIALASANDNNTLHYLHVGKNLEIKIDADGEFAGIKYRVNKLKTLEIIKNDAGELISSIAKIDPQIRIRDVTSSIQGNLFSTADQLNIPYRAISKLSSIFRWDVDFARDIQPGDRFSLIYEEKYVGEKLIETGDILAAEFIINGNITRAIMHKNENGIAQYYTPEGKSLRKAFMRSPMKYAKVTSGFTMRRYHPVLKKWRAHKGVDYGAPKGTPIMATADGVIEHLGRKGAYGKAVVINHGEGYSTLYGHMSGYRKGLKSGSRVTQGQIIGYVGSTGLATGPHLHYEFRIGGKHVDPLAIDLPRSLPIDSQELNEFIAASEKWIRRLDVLQGQSVASITPNGQPSI